MSKHFSKRSFTPYQISLLKEMKGTSIANGITRRELVDNLNSHRTTVYDNLLKFLKWELVGKEAHNDGTRGRPFVYWYLTFLGRDVVKSLNI